MADRKKRIVWLIGEINEYSVSDAIRELHFLESQEIAPIRLFIKSKGGEVDQGNYLREIILRNIQSPIITIACSEVRSMATSIFACGSLRLTLPQTLFVYHKVGHRIDRAEHMNADSFLRHAADLIPKTKKYAEDCTVHRATHLKKCKLSAKKLVKKMDKDKKGRYVIGALEATRLGFVDAMIQYFSDIDNFEQDLVKQIQKLEKGE